MSLGGRLKSESRIDPFWRYLGAMGVAPTWECSEEFQRIGMTATRATFQCEHYGFTALQVRLIYTASAGFNARVLSIVSDPDYPPSDMTPTTWEAVPAAPDGGAFNLAAVAAGAGAVIGWTIEWDAAVVSDMCSILRNAT
jgi:hypothetical protein